MQLNQSVTFFYILINKMFKIHHIFYEYKKDLYHQQTDKYQMLLNSYINHLYIKEITRDQALNLVGQHVKQHAH